MPRPGRENWWSDCIPGLRYSSGYAVSTTRTSRSCHASAPDAGILDTSWDYAVVGDFDSAEGFLTYRNHPVHQKLIREHVEPIAVDRVSVQLQLD